MESFTEQETTQATGSITDFKNTALPEQIKEGSKESVTNPDDDWSIIEVLNQENTEPETIMAEEPQDTETIVAEESQDTQMSRYPNRT